MRVVFAIPLFLSTYQTIGQSDKIGHETVIERTIEFIGEANDDGDIDYTALIEDFYFFLENPINLNQAVFADLARLGLLSDIQIQAIVNYKKRYSKFLTIYELDAIEALDFEIIQMILPYVYVGKNKVPKTNWTEAFRDGKHDILSRYQRVLELKAGYRSFSDSVLFENPNMIYQGNADRYFLRYRYNYKNKISYGITAEKDAGETFFRGVNRYGFDFYSSHFMISGAGKVKTIIVGDFQANFGQGLNIWTGFNKGKTAQTLSVKQSGGGLRPYTSANESRFFRGLGIAFDFNRFQTSVFASYRKLDASIDNGSDSLPLIDNFQLTGYHRTLDEIQNKNSVGQMVIGAATSFQTSQMKVNATAIFAQTDHKFEVSSALHNQFGYKDQSGMSFGFDYQYQLSKLSFFGEVAAALNGKVNTINGMYWKVDSKLSLVMVHNYFDKENHNVFGNNFTNKTQNSRGTYFGLESDVTARIKVLVYYDYRRSDWLRYSIDGPSTERSFLGQINFSHSSNTKVYVRIRSKLRDRNISRTAEAIAQQGIQESTSIRVNYMQRINPRISVKSRLEVLQYVFDNTKSSGLVIYQDLIFKLKKIPLKLYARYAIFDTDDYNSRIYTYENDLRYVFSVPALFYQGFRTYVMAKYDLGSKVDLWFRWSRTSYASRNTISSGLERIEGHFKSEIKAQLKIRF